LSSKAKQILLWLVIISSAMVFAYFLQSNKDKNPQELSFTQALTQVRNKDIKEITLKQNVLELVDKNGVKFTANLDTSDAPRDSILKAADEAGTTVTSNLLRAVGVGFY
jgi:ATP-dependent Zn protease